MAAGDAVACGRSPRAGRQRTLLQAAGDVAPDGRRRQETVRWAGGAAAPSGRCPSAEWQLMVRWEWTAEVEALRGTERGALSPGCLGALMVLLAILGFWSGGQIRFNEIAKEMAMHLAPLGHDLVGVRTGLVESCG